MSRTFAMSKEVTPLFRCLLENTVSNYSHQSEEKLQIGSYNDLSRMCSIYKFYLNSVLKNIDVIGRNTRK